MPPRRAPAADLTQDLLANAAYRQKLHTLYRIAHGMEIKRGKAARQALTDAQVGAFRTWLTPALLDRLLGELQERYPNKATLSSMLTPLYLAIGQTYGATSPHYKRYQKEAVQKRHEVDEAAGESLLKEGYVPLTTFEAWREELRKESLKLKADPATYWAWLALCLYTLNPPLRGEWANMRVVDSALKASSDSKQNYLVRAPGKPMTLVIKNDKVTKYLGAATLPVEPGLQAILERSLSAFPRDYVLPARRAGALIKTSMDARKPMDGRDDATGKADPANLSNLLKTVFRERGLTKPIQRLRTAYASSLRVGYLAPGRPNNYRKELARRMRHNQSTGMQHYALVDPAQLAQLAGMQAPAPAGAHPTGPTGGAPLFNRQAYNKEYHKENREAILARKRAAYAADPLPKLRADTLRELNSGSIKAPRPETVQKLGIEQRDGVWVAAKKARTK